MAINQLQRGQLTLVSHYGPKPEAFARLIMELQARLAISLEGSFEPYTVPQVHGTLIGLEGQRVGERVRNGNFWRLRGHDCAMNFEALLAFLRSQSFPAIQLTIGGFRPYELYPFTSQGQHPYLRSFSVQKRRVVAMGWPFGNSAPGVLNALRKRFQDFGVLHKWHARMDSVDDDFFFVLGQLRSELREERIAAIEAECREALSFGSPCVLRLGSDTLAFVQYADSRLMPERSRTFGIWDEAATPSRLAAVYSSCDSREI
jgi:hypothetical protein